MKTFTLENVHTRAVFSTESGTLIELINLRTGWSLIHPDAPALSFRLQVPLPGKRTNFVYGEDQSLTACEPAADGASVTFTWSRVTGRYGDDLDIDFSATVHLVPEGLSFEGKVINRSAYTVETAAYPCVGGIVPSKPGRKLERHAPGWCSLVSRELFPIFQNGKGYWGVHHPADGDHTNRDGLFALLSEEGQGFYLGCHDPSLRYMTCWYFEQRPGYEDTYTNRLPEPGSLVEGQIVRAEFAMQHFAYVEPGQTVELAPVVVEGYRGGWQDGVDLYKKWRKSWHTRPQIPAWVQDVHAWLQIQIFAAEDEMNFRYADLPAIARECKEAGILAIQLTGWADGGQDRGNPSHRIDPALGTEEALRAAIAECEAMGVRIILFTKWTWWDQGREDYATEGIKHIVLNPWGYPYPYCGYQYYGWTQLAGLNTRPLVATCTASAAWRARALVEFERVTALGASGMLFDECQHHAASHHCFSPDHGHKVPDYLFHYDNELARTFKAHSATVAPDFLFAGEMCYDVEMQEYHLLYTRFSEGHVPCYRYTAPDVPIMMQAIGFNDRNQLNKCLEYRYIISYEPYCFKGRPSDAPQTVAYGRKVDDLRRRYRTWLWDGKFEGTRGADVARDGVPTTDFSTYFAPRTGSRAVVVCNVSETDSIEASVHIPEADGYACVSPDQPEPVINQGTATIPPRSALVWLPTNAGSG